MLGLDITIANALGHRVRIDFCQYPYRPGNYSGQRLCARHTAKSGCHKQFAAKIIRTQPVQAASVEQRNGSSVYNPLRTNIHK